MSKIRLEPCPFCGHTKSRITQKKVAGTYHNWTDSRYEFVKIRYRVMCNKCKATGKSIVTPKMYYRPIESLNRAIYSAETCRHYKEMAMYAWNLRKGGKDK